MKIWIEYPFQEGAWGGGNQFLKNLKKIFNSLGILGKSPDDSEAILFNSHQDAQKILNLRELYPTKKFIHRVDGPMRLYNTLEDDRDSIVYHLNQGVADATIFQSQWSLDQNLKMGLNPPRHHKVIYNSADSSLFYPQARKSTTQKKTIVSTSFSSNIKKGFKVYDFLDKNLEFNNFTYYFCGRSPVSFKNIKSLGLLNAPEVAKVLRKSHVYITASENDPCSNSLIEAVFSGLTCFALRSGGHPEILGTNNFDTPEELLNKLGSLSLASPPSYSIASNSLEKVAAHYKIFIESIL